MSEQKQHDLPATSHKPAGKSAGDAEMAEVVPPTKEAAEEEKRRKEAEVTFGPPSTDVPYTGATPNTPEAKKKDAELRKFKAEQEIKDAEKDIADADKAIKEREKQEKQEHNK